MSDTETETAAVLNPRTGEVVDLTADTAELAAYLADVRQWERDFLRGCKRAVELELIRRMDRDAKYTLRAGGLEITGDGPGRVKYEEEVLRAQLRPLVQQDIISQDAMNAAVKEVVTYQVMARGVNALKKLGGPVAEAVAAATRLSDDPRRVQVKPR